MIKEQFVKLKNHNFAQATFWIVLATMLLNIGSFTYLLVQAHLLKTNDYSLLVTFISILGLVAVPASILQIIVISLVAESKGKDDYHKITAVYYFFARLLTVLGFLLFIFYLLFGNKINEFLHVQDSRFLLIVFLISVLYFYIVLVRSVLQGSFHFKDYAFSAFIEMALKLLLPIAFYLFGFGVFGALVSYLSTEAVVLAYSYIRIKVYLKPVSKTNLIQKSEVLKISLPASFFLFGITSFYTSDILLVQHFSPILPGNQAFLYAGVSTIGKIIFFVNLGIASTLLPLSTEKYVKKQSPKKIFLASLFLVALTSTIATIVFFLLPRYLIFIVGSKNYQDAIPFLGPFAVFMAFLSLVYLITNFMFSIKRFEVSYLIFLGSLFQIFGINLFHSSINEIINISILSTGSLLAILSLYCLFVLRKATSRN